MWTENIREEYNLGIMGKYYRILKTDLFGILFCTLLNLRTDVEGGFLINKLTVISVFLIPSK